MIESDKEKTKFALKIVKETNLKEIMVSIHGKCLHFFACRIFYVMVMLVILF